MAIQRCTRFATAFLLAEPAMGHVAQLTPMSRQVANSRLNGKIKGVSPDFEPTPDAFASGGAVRCKQRGLDKISDEVLANRGGGRDFARFFAFPLAENGNWLEPNPIAKRHFVCGDPRLGRDEHHIPYSTHANQWEPLATYVKGQVIEMELFIRFYHKGHFEFSICDASDVGMPTQACFNQYPLTRANGDDDNSPIDPNYPGRYYLAPPCTAYERGQGINRNVDWDKEDAYEPYVATVRYNLPEITCTHCILQMHYFTGHRFTRYHGYDEFNPRSWPSTCAPDKDAWVIYQGDNREEDYPEEFWNCSDIAIASDACGAYGGILADDRHDDACCAATCGKCEAGPGGNCKNRPGGRTDCCPYNIRMNADRCSENNPAPCKL